MWECWATNSQWCIAISWKNDNCMGIGWLVIAVGGHNNEGGMTVLLEPTTT